MLYHNYVYMKEYYKKIKRNDVMRYPFGNSICPIQYYNVSSAGIFHAESTMEKIFPLCNLGLA